MPITPPPTLTALAPGVFAYVQPDGGWCVSNAGVLVGREAVTLVDATATVPRALHLREHIDSVTPAAVGTLIVTHRHGDHHYGACAVAPDATVVAHERTRELLLSDGLNLPGIWPDVAWGEVALRAPSVTFTDRLTLWVDELRVELIHPGPAHTAGDAVVWVPEHRILFTGDITFSGVTPLYLMGSLTGTLRALDLLRALEPEIVVSGHGPVTGPEVFDANAAYLRWVQELAAEGRAAGRTPLETAQTADLGAFKSLLDSERLVANLHRGYAELSGLPEAAELPVPAVLGDMVVFNGGRIPTCLA
ncbi:MBL fold metallo-hydrolase [Catellatospora sp. TT07R-123]|uniref:MBL fold metallo-hydrolase n=1 Tax=Catellatospora sp. TT07R-123 TaxID=2733863 RepID=UPI001AFE94AA|nr:MBL fold metallo-hydrolase [Catellatospora sp. TT07R-123]GHJ49200.1 MBL fold metallo-hydrolase [Catellatospora sp. TT07R-123]